MVASNAWRNPVPTYEYACSTCDTTHEVQQKMTDATLTDCPSCGESTLRKLFTNVGVVFKGSGFYRTDSRNSSGSSGSAGSSGSSGSGSSSTSSSGSGSSGSGSSGSGSSGSGSSGSGSSGSSGSSGGSSSGSSSSS
jgi:putative FmdB family regulatory protein